jgi:hypothetical protein
MNLSVSTAQTLGKQLSYNNNNNNNNKKITKYRKQLYLAMQTYYGKC